MLVDGQDRRINVGPPDVVGDSTKISGTVEIVNGLSCIGCHDRGMKPFKDEVRLAARVGGVCMEEHPKQLIAEGSRPVPLAPGQPARIDYECVREGVCTVWMFV